MATAKKSIKTNKKTTAKKAVAKKDVVKKTVKRSVSGQTSAAQKSSTKKVAKTATKKTSVKQAAGKAAKKEPVKKSSKGAGENRTSQKSSSKAKKPEVFRCPISGIPVKPEKPNLSDKTLARLKELLLQERQRHIAQSQELEQEAVDLVTDREGGDTQFDEESGEGDSVAVERERTLFLSAEALSTVDEIDKALERMKNKTYGLCTPSSRRINVARLEAIPWTTVCVDCKARSERPR